MTCSLKKRWPFEWCIWGEKYFLCINYAKICVNGNTAQPSCSVGKCLSPRSGFWTLFSSLFNLLSAAAITAYSFDTRTCTGLDMVEACPFILAQVISINFYITIPLQTKFGGTFRFRPVCWNFIFSSLQHCYETL